MSAASEQAASEVAAGQRAGGETTDGATGQSAEPLFKVVHGNPDDTELAALTAVLVAMANGAATGTEEDESSQIGPWRRLPRWPPAPGPTSWRWATGP